MADGEYEPPAPVRNAESVYIFRYDPETKLPVVVGKVFIDSDGNAWVRINATDLAAGIGVEDIDGVALMNREQFNALPDA
jgi:hypothetical protein